MMTVRDWLLWGAMMIIMVACSIMAGVAGFLLVSSLSPARAHQAPTGWNYPTSCCSGNDCAEVSGAKVRETPDGYRITLDPGDHQMIHTHTVIRVPYGDKRIKDSPDGEFHVCVGQQSVAEGIVSGGGLICFFVPPRGF